MSKNLQTIRWISNDSDYYLEMIDQRVLPEKIEYVKFDSALSVAKGITDMVVRGAPAIGVAAAYGIALESIRLYKNNDSNFHKNLEKGFSKLSASRPTAVNLFWALKIMKDCLKKHIDKDAKFISKNLLDMAHFLYHDDIRINKEIGNNGEKLINDNSTVLTHCNAGALATAGHGTALGVIRSAVAGGKKIRVFADETRPFLQGARLTTWEMLQENIPVTLITDAMSGYLMSKGEIDTVVVGTDRVAANGDVANKIGTYMLAVLANRHNIPFYVACPTSSIDLNIKTGSEIPIEERDPSEVLGFGEYQWAPKTVSVRNPAFDITPSELVNALITEKGLIYNTEFSKIKSYL